MFDVKNKQKIQINLNSNPNYSISYFISVSVNDDLYAIFLADRDCDETEWREAIELYKFDFEKKELIYINYHPNFDMTETVYSRGSRIYFLNSRNIQNFICTYYDTETGKWGEEFSITQEEILKM